MRAPHLVLVQSRQPYGDRTSVVVRNSKEYRDVMHLLLSVRTEDTVYVETVLACDVVDSSLDVSDVVVHRTLR